MLHIDAITIISLSSIAIMFYALWLVLHFKKAVPRGVVRSVWNYLVLLVLFFSLAYLTTPFFRFIPEDIMRFVAAFIFFFGAIYVVITVRLTYRIIKGLSEEGLESDASKIKKMSKDISHILYRIPNLTEKGKQEIISHQAGVKLEYRWILVLIDGKSTIKEILDKARGVDNTPAILIDLINEEYVEITQTYDLIGEFVKIASNVLGKDSKIIIRKLNECSYKHDSILKTILEVKKNVHAVIGEDKANMVEIEMKKAASRVTWL
ncbi:MAG: hypothetical protein HY035_04190 [Nitrospirae bacterium]|nr:hypothetical protein [Nitrospirota bacterium]MBI3377588.1 hypothetical protein [Nitrospirota bacterium]